MRIGENIRLYRSEKKMTQEELAGILSVSAQAVSKWEREECLPDAALLPELADALEVSLDRLFEREQVNREDITHAVTKYLKKFSEKDRTASTMEIAYICELGQYIDPTSDFYSVCIENEGGFSIGSKNLAFPFIGIFPEPEDGWKKLLAPEEDYRRFFEILSDSEVLKTILALYEREKGFAFDGEYAKNAFDLEEPERVLDKICELRLLECETINLNGQDRRSWIFTPQCGIVALFVLLHEYLRHNRRFLCGSNSRTNPYFSN